MKAETEYLPDLGKLVRRMTMGLNFDTEHGRRAGKKTVSLFFLSAFGLKGRLRKT